MMIMIFVLGILFGLTLQYASLNKFNVISGLAILENLSVVKAIALAIGVGIILLNFEIAFGFASFHIKPFVVGGLILGGLIFGMGMAILGYCPGTLAISLGEGSIDALIGIIGGLSGGLIYSLVLPFIQPILGPDLGALSLNTTLGSTTMYYILSSIFAIVFIAASFWLQKVDKVKGKKWIFSGIVLAILNSIVFSSVLTNRPIGASTAFPYVGDLLLGLTHNNYFTKIESAGNWEMIFLAGAFIAALSISVIKKDFKLVLIHDNWRRYKGDSKLKRIIWSFVGGFILIFGARMAGGCTSGHILSGGMQLAYSSLFFAVFTFVGLLVTGKLFYKSNLNKNS
ncbi:YeeE/YedE family protein [Maribacter sp. ANRC-HE7]|uniref:YeeE/YedE family protein n=1 Tax=Maribacter aquimaris TaxID=2737171 RepID=A0ABR7V2B6_9FLAO|nr:YeeE/YedE thiosulfate transporter family protein [Maribacter aquimaris]MBD0778918.1 YeeE/YedE family protein [Maribacter aquimaris]